jgi:hypothetical protein
MAETKEEKLARIRSEQGIQVLSENEVDPDSGLTWSDRSRLAASGLLFNFADEFVAGIKALSPNITYDEALEGERESLESARSKPGSLKYEIGGALLPTAGAIALAPFTGGSSAAATAPTWARLAAIGAAQGTAYGVGGSEEKGLSRVKDAPVSAITGAVANPLLAKLSQGAQALVSPVIDKIRRTITGKVGKKVEDELLRVINDSGLEVEDVLERISKGEIIPEMSAETAEVIRGLLSKAGPGSKIVRDEVSKRKSDFIKDVYESLQKDLAPNSRGGNIFKTFSENKNLLEKAESEAYEAIWKGTENQKFKNIDNVILSIANVSRNSRNLINKKFDENGLKPIFKMVGKGKNQKLQLTRSLTLKEGEIAKRAFMDAKNSAFKSGASDKGSTMKNYESQIKNVLDEISPELKQTRNNWSKIKSSADLYKQGTTIFRKDPEEFAVEFKRLTELFDVEGIEALRAGAAAALKLKSKSTSAVGTITKLSDQKLGINQKEREILEILYPGDALETILQKINLARGAIVAEGKIFGGSPTAKAIGTASRVGQVGQTATDIARVVNSAGTDIGAIKNIASKIFGGKAPEFTDEQYIQISKLLIEKDSEILRRALTDDTALDQALKRIQQIITALSASQPRVAGSVIATENIGEATNPLISGSIEAIINSISPETTQKVNKAVNQ